MNAKCPLQSVDANPTATPTAHYGQAKQLAQSELLRGGYYRLLAIKDLTLDSQRILDRSLSLILA